MLLGSQQKINLSFGSLLVINFKLCYCDASCQNAPQELLLAMGVGPISLPGLRLVDYQ